jgi:PAS domain-containing protein
MTNAANDKSCSDDLDAKSASSTASPPEFLWEVVEETRDHALILLDPEGRIVSWHDGARALLGYEASEIIGTHFSRLYPTHAIEGCWPEIELKLARKVGLPARAGACAVMVRASGRLLSWLPCAIARVSCADSASSRAIRRTSGALGFLMPPNLTASPPPLRARSHSGREASDAGFADTADAVVGQEPGHEPPD